MIPLEHSFRNAIKAISKFATVIQKFEDNEVETVSLSIEDYVCVLQSVSKICRYLGEA
jgi:L-lactate utilization protein LutC